MALKTMMEDCDAGWKPGTLNIVVPVKRGQFISEPFLGKILKPTIVLRRNEWLESSEDLQPLSKGSLTLGHTCPALFRRILTHIGKEQTKLRWSICVWYTDLAHLLHEKRETIDLKNITVDTQQLGVKEGNWKLSSVPGEYFREGHVSRQTGLIIGLCAIEVALCYTGKGLSNK
ncbi:hypothetical protein L208DRAFT_1379984 [Tricholoma matsutake]|nr:hypothetical protein L208DRAFT_1379984 [Tricholoma matsutake 945]